MHLIDCILSTVWDAPTKFEVTLDKVDPCHTAIIEWDKPVGVDMFELHIESLDSKKVDVVKVCNNKYRFESGTSGSTYNVKLYWGYNNIMSCDFLPLTFTMSMSCKMLPLSVHRSVVFI